MTKYIAFLRAINVGGHTIIKMTDRKQMFKSSGLGNVQTYIQSGNVIFESDEDDTPFLEGIARQVESAWGYKTELFVRSIREVQSIVTKSPFTAKGDETLHIGFLKEKPDRNIKRSC
ncbi:MAG TPA: DUF1697 domain-containing protein [Anaerolineales bacterium]|nr:DUF1697 domain-containing protein [Anaerolineales bacterium]